MSILWSQQKRRSIHVFSVGLRAVAKAPAAFAEHVLGDVSYGLRAHVCLCSRMGAVAVRTSIMKGNASWIDSLDVSLDSHAAIGLRNHFLRSMKNLRAMHGAKPV